MGQYVPVIVGVLIALSLVLVIGLMAYDGLRERSTAPGSGDDPRH